MSELDLSDLCGSDSPDTRERCTLPASQHDGLLIQHERWRDGMCVERWAD